MHGGYPEATLERFLKARDMDVTKASKMVSTEHLMNWQCSTGFFSMCPSIFIFCRISNSIFRQFIAFIRLMCSLLIA